MNTFLRQSTSGKNHRAQILFLLLFSCLTVPGIAQEAQIDPQITSNGGELQEGGFGVLLSSIGQPLASDSIVVSASSDEATWIGFWHIVPSDTTSGVYEEWASGGVGSTGITATAPNPFSDELTVNVRLEAPANVRLGVYDMLGRETQTLMDGAREAGTTRIRWEPENLNPGTYILRLEIDGAQFPAHTIQYVK